MHAMSFCAIHRSGVRAGIQVVWMLVLYLYTFGILGCIKHQHSTSGGRCTGQLERSSRRVYRPDRTRSDWAPTEYRTFVRALSPRRTQVSSSGWVQQEHTRTTPTYARIYACSLTYMLLHCHSSAIPTISTPPRQRQQPVLVLLSPDAPC